MTKVAAGITTSLDGYITGPNDGPGRASAKAASDCTTGSRRPLELRRGPDRRGDRRGQGVPRRRFSPPESAPSSVAATPTRQPGGLGRPQPVRRAVLHRDAPTRRRPADAGFTLRGRTGRGHRQPARPPATRTCSPRRRHHPPGPARRPRRGARDPIAPVVLGAGKRLFDDFDQPLTLEHLSLLQSPFATHISYRVVR